MNILITNFHLKDGGGHRTYIKYIFQHLNSENLSIYLAAPSSSKLNKDCKEIFRSRVFDIEFPAKLSELFRMMRSIFQIRKILLNKNINIVHVNGSPDHKVIALIRWIYGLKFKILRTKHDSSLIKTSFIHKKIFHEYTDYLILVSNFQLANISDNFIRNKSLVIQNGIDINHFKSIPRSDKLSKKYSLKMDDLVFISTAGTAPHKGWNFLLDAIERLNPDAVKKIKVFILGNKPEEQVLKKHESKNIFFPGLIQDVRDYVSLADVGFVLSYRVETISYACREMMSMGIPVIVSSYAGLPENIDIEKNGWVVDTDNLEEITKLINSLTRKNLEKFSINARKKAVDEFDIKKKNEQLKQIYYSLMSN